MIGYETYKLLHVFFILCFFSSLGFVFTQASFIEKTKGKWVVGIVSFLIMVAGMGLIARLGFKHNQPFPLWIKLKFVNWVLINLLFIGLFKMKGNQIKSFIVGLLLFLAGLSIWLAVNKPL
jgi:hypothetical protein